MFVCVCIRSELVICPFSRRSALAREDWPATNVPYVGRSCLKKSLLLSFPPPFPPSPFKVMAVGVERNVQEMLMGQKKTKRGQGKVPYPVSEYSTDLANLCVVNPCIVRGIMLISVLGISGITCSLRAFGGLQPFITSPHHRDSYWTLVVEQAGGS